nr:hypothetical protein GCM10017745_15670 [Saccharothrix mutabilis subsp. capreolus]
MPGVLEAGRAVGRVGWVGVLRRGWVERAGVTEVSARDGRVTGAAASAGGGRRGRRQARAVRGSGGRRGRR